MSLTLFIVPLLSEGEDAVVQIIRTGSKVLFGRASNLSTFSAKRHELSGEIAKVIMK